MDKKAARERRRRRTRYKIKELDVNRLCVFRTPKHIYAQIIAPGGGQTLVSASTVEAEVKKEISYGGNVAAANTVGRLVAERAKQLGISRVAFDRSGFRYHGRVKALADTAREHGLEF